MQVDAMSFPRPLREMQRFATDVQQAGFSGLLLTEGGRTAYLAAAAATLAAPRLDILTGVAVAFPRSPMVTAQVAWELAEASDGRFRLGLGTQVRTHVERRYGTSFDPPGPRLREYVLALQAIFRAFRGEAALDFRGRHYELTFLNRQWSPGPIPVPDPPVDIAAVNPWMLRMAGEVADGLHVHPLGHPGYLRDTALPQVAAGAEKAGRRAAEVTVIVPVLTIVGDTDRERDAGRQAVRAQLSFYGSTPTYAFIFDEAGFEGTTARLRERQKAGDLGGMMNLITDDHLATFATESTWDGLADALIARYRGLADRLVLYLAGGAWGDDPETFRRYGEVAAQIRRSTEPA